MVACVLAWVFARPVSLRAKIEAAVDARDFSRARVLIESALADDANNTELLLVAARTARRSDDAPSARTYRERYLRAGGSKAEAEFEETLQKNQDGDTSGAAAALQLCKANPDLPQAPLILEAVTRGYLHRQPNLAIQSADVWLRRDPSTVERAYALRLRGLARERTGDGPGAALDYRASLEANPRDDECRFRLAEVVSRDEPDEAIGQYGMLLERDPDNVAYRLGLARCRRSLGELDTAGELLTRMIETNPSDVDVLTELGKWHLDRREPIEAERRLRRALELRPFARDPNVQLARCLHQQGRTTDAEKQWEMVHRIDAALFHESGK
jgi:tetratricopeptide (TPR) repeat protein